MSQLQIKSNLPMGLAWVWVKSSFAIFREKPINFLFFSFMLIAFSLLPFMGSFFATVITLRIILSANYVEKSNNFGLGLNFGLILRQRNLLSFAIFSLGLDFILMSVASEIIASHGGDPSNITTLLSNPNLIYMLFAINIFKVIFIGISPSLMVFNHQIGVFTAIKINLIFIVKNIIVLICSIFLLLPFIVIPLYLLSILALSITNFVLFCIVLFVLLIFLLVAINVVTIFGYNIYKDGISHE